MERRGRLSTVPALSEGLERGTTDTASPLRRYWPPDFTGFLYWAANAAFGWLRKQSAANLSLPLKFPDIRQSAGNFSHFAGNLVLRRIKSSRRARLLVRNSLGDGAGNSRAEIEALVTGAGSEEERKEQGSKANSARLVRWPSVIIFGLLGLCEVMPPGAEPSGPKKPDPRYPKHAAHNVLAFGNISKGWWGANRATIGRTPDSAGHPALLQCLKGAGGVIPWITFRSGCGCLRPSRPRSGSRRTRHNPGFVEPSPREPSRFEAN
jgi:hypothetical protein